MTGNLYFLKTHNVASAHIEVHRATAASGYQQLDLHAASAFAAGDADNGTWTIGSGGDLYLIKTQNVASGHIEVHRATAASGYQQLDLHAASAFAAGDADNGTWTIGSGGDLYLIKTQNVASGHIEVHRATAASGYQQLDLHAASGFAAGDADNGTWTIGSGGDLYLIKTQNVASGHIEVHRATAASGYQQLDLHAASGFAAGDADNGTWTIGSGGDLYLIKTQNVASGHIEVHRATAASGYQQLDLHAASAFAAGDADNGTWTIEFQATGDPQLQIRHRLNAQETLGVEAQLEAPTRPYTLEMQGDGNLVLYRADVGRARWASNTAGHAGATAIMQTDGNLVVYEDGTALWSSGTGGHLGAYLELQDDGNLVIYGAQRSVLWASGTVEPDALIAKPAIVTVQSGAQRLGVIFVRGIDSTLWVRRVGAPGNEWKQVDPTLITSAPSAVSYSVGSRIDVFARGRDGDLLHGTLMGEWSGWQSLGGQLTSDPSAVASTGNRLDVYARGVDGSLMHTRFDGQWRGWVSHGGQLRSAPSAVYVGNGPDGDVQVFAVGTDQGVWQRSMHGWFSLGGNTRTSPTALSADHGHIELVSLHTDGKIYRRQYDAAQWSPWTELGAMPTLSEPQQTVVQPVKISPEGPRVTTATAVRPQAWAYCDRQYAACCDAADEIENEFLRNLQFTICQMAKAKCEAEAAGKSALEWVEQTTEKIGAWIAANAAAIGVALAVVAVVGAIVVCIVCPPAAPVILTTVIIAF